MFRLFLTYGNDFLSSRQILSGNCILKSNGNFKSRMEMF